MNLRKDPIVFYPSVLEGIALGSGKWMYFVLAGTRAGGSEV